MRLRFVESVATMTLLFSIACATSRNSVDELMRDFTGSVPGASVLVVKDGRAVFRKGYGLADLENNTRTSPQTNYRLASITKQFTATAILLLADREQLSLNDSIRRYLPTLPAWGDGITIRQLLTHTSGVADYEDRILEGTTTQLRDADVLRSLEQQRHNYFEPGSDYRYSNTGYAFLALIVEAVSGKSFATFLRDEIFRPLEMNQTVAFEDGISTVANRAYGYSRKDGRWVRTDQSLTSAILGDGGVYSSIDDLTRWDAAIERGALLRPETWNLAFTGQTKTDKEDIQYGFGWRIAAHRGRRTISHTGETIGFRNALIRFPDDGLTVIVLTNRNDANARDLALAIADQFL